MPHSKISAVRIISRGKRLSVYVNVKKRFIIIDVKAAFDTSLYLDSKNFSFVPHFIFKRGATESIVVVDHESIFFVNFLPPRIP